MCVQLKCLPSDNSGEETPVPIPNTEVKLSSADGSWGQRPCKSRSSLGNSYGGLAQLGEHLPYKQGVGGSIPSSSTMIIHMKCDFPYMPA
jgi:hypothetical protein